MGVTWGGIGAAGGAAGAIGERVSPGSSFIAGGIGGALVGATAIPLIMGRGSFARAEVPYGMVLGGVLGALGGYSGTAGAREAGNPQRLTT